MCMILIAIIFPIAETIPSSISKSAVVQESNRLLFFGFSSGTALVFWGANGYPGATVGEPEYVTNDSDGFFLFPVTGLKGRELFPPEEWNVTDVWDIENVWTFPIMSIRWNHEGESHRFYARFFGNDDTNFQHLRTPMQNNGDTPWEAESIISGFNIESEMVPENYSNHSNLLFEGRYNGEKIFGKANCMVFYNSEEDNGFILVNLLIEDLNTMVCFGWSNLDWTPWNGISKVLKAYFKII